MIPQNSTVLVNRIAGRSADAIQIAGTPTDAITASYCPTPHPIDLQNFVCGYSVRIERMMGWHPTSQLLNQCRNQVHLQVLMMKRSQHLGVSLMQLRLSGEVLYLEVDMMVDSWATILIVQWKGRHPLLAMFATVVVFLDISFGSAQQGASRLHLATGYICYKCGVPGHFIHSCPNEIHMKSCSRKKNSCPNYGNRRYESRRTSSLIPIVSSFDDVVPAELLQDMSSSVADSLPAELHCPLCKKVMTDAMFSSKCCYDSFCDKCIRDYNITQSKCLCGVKILADDLIPNQTLRITISSLLSSRAGGLSSGTGNLASSNSSNLDGNSVTASAVLKGDTKQQMGSAPSATTEGSCLITACKNPVEKSTHSNLQSKTEETEKTSVKKTKAATGATETFPEPRCQKQPQLDGVAIVSGKLERKVVRTKSEKKQKKAGATGNGNTNCAEYGFNIPFEPPCYDSLFGLGGQPWGADPYMYCMPNMPSFSYLLGPYNVNGISNLPLLSPGMQGYPASHYSSEFQLRVLQDPEASAHARQSKRSKGAGLSSHKPERYRSHTSTQKGGSKRGARLVLKTRDSSIESDDYHEEFHGRKKMGAHPTTNPMDSGQCRRGQDSDCKKVAAHPTTSPRDAGGQHRRAQDSSISELHDNNEEPHGRKKARARSRSQRSSSRHSYRRHAYEGSTSSDDADEDSNFKRRW